MLFSTGKNKFYRDLKSVIGSIKSFRFSRSCILAVKKMKHSLVFAFAFSAGFSISQSIVFEKGPDIPGYIEMIKPLYADSVRMFCFMKTGNRTYWMQKYDTRTFGLSEEYLLPLVDSANPYIEEPVHLFKVNYLVPFYHNQKRQLRKGFYMFSAEYGADTSRFISMRENEKLLITPDEKREQFFISSLEKVNKKGEWMVLNVEGYDKSLNRMYAARDSVPAKGDSYYLLQNAVSDEKGDLWALMYVQPRKGDKYHLLFHFSRSGKKLSRSLVKTIDKLDHSYLVISPGGKKLIMGTLVGTVGKTIKFSVITHAVVYHTEDDGKITARNAIPVSAQVQWIRPGQDENKNPLIVPKDMGFVEARYFSDSTVTLVYEQSGVSKMPVEGGETYTYYNGGVWLVTFTKKGVFVKMSFVPKYQLNKIESYYEEKNLSLLGVNISWTKTYTSGNRNIELFFSHHLLKYGDRELVIFNDHRNNLRFDPSAYDAAKNPVLPLKSFENACLHAWETSPSPKHWPVAGETDNSLMLTSSCYSNGNFIVGVFDDGKKWYWGKIIPN